MAIQVEDYALAGSIESMLRQGQQAGIIVDADFAGSEAAVIAAIEAKRSKMHVSQQILIDSMKKAVPQITRVTGNAALVTGGSLANIYAAIDGTWQSGFTIGL